MASQANWNAALPCALRAGVTVFGLNHAACLQLISPHQPNNPPPTDPQPRPRGGLIFNAVTCPPSPHPACRALLYPVAACSQFLAQPGQQSSSPPKTHNHRPPQIPSGHPPTPEPGNFQCWHRRGKVMKAAAGHTRAGSWWRRRVRRCLRRTMRWLEKAKGQLPAEKATDRGGESHPEPLGSGTRCWPTPPTVTAPSTTTRLVVLRFRPRRQGLGDSGQLHRDLQKVRHQSPAVPERHTRVLAGHVKPGPLHLAAVLPSGSSIGMIAKLKTHLNQRPLSVRPEVFHQTDTQKETSGQVAGSPVDQLHRCQRIKGGGSNRKV